MPTETKHVHDCTGPDGTCPCGYVLHIPPICFGLEIFNKDRVILQDHFNCESVATAIGALRQAIRKLESMR